jgi:hypothetical protein
MIENPNNTCAKIPFDKLCGNSTKIDKNRGKPP